MSREEYIKQEIEKIGLSVSDKQAGQFLSYYEMIVEKNKVMNLTRITDFEEAVQRHFADSLALAKYKDITKMKSVFDLGTGGGFPGIPMKIMFPHLKVTMLDSVGKKISFVNEVIAKLDLEDAEGIHARAEDLARDRKYREKYDVCTSRAVANLTTLSEYCMPFVRIGGIFAAYKSGEYQQEVADAERALQLLGAGDAEIYEYTMENRDCSLIICKKIKKTAMNYPRKAGVPAKSPLR